MEKGGGGAEKSRIKTGEITALDAVALRCLLDENREKASPPPLPGNRSTELGY